MLFKKEGNHTNQELIECQLLIHNFRKRMADIFGRNYFTNHFHFLISDHAHDRIVEWGNLNRYLKQGWEALNSLIKDFFPKDK